MAQLKDLLVAGASRFIGDVYANTIQVTSLKVGNILPLATNTYTLGSSSLRWKNVYIGTADSYGATDKPIYWNAGVPAAITKTAGSSIKGAYFDAGTIKEMTYSLSATIKAGTTKQVAYYSGANEISGTATMTVESNHIAVTFNSNTFSFGSQNTSYNHLYNSANIPFIFNNSVLTTTGNLGNTAYPFNNIYLGTAASSNTGAGHGIYYVGNQATTQMIQFLNNTADAYGNGVKIGGGGVVVIGAGESTGLSVSAGTENLYLLADETTYVYSTAQTLTNRVGFAISSGNILPQKAEAANNLIQNLGADGNAWKGLYAGNIYLRRQNSTAYGRISFYQPDYRTWITYMSNNADGACPTGGKPATTTEVTSWAMHSIIENSSGYGWIWEASSNAAASSSTVQPTARMSLSSNTGRLRIEGNASTATNQTSQLIVSSDLNADDGNVALELWRGANCSWQFANESGTLHIRNNYTTAVQTTYSVDSMTIAYNTSIVTLNGTTDSSSTTTGTLIVKGGTGIAKTLYVGTGIHAGNLTIGGTVDTDAGKTIASNSTLYLKTTSSASVIFGINGSNVARFDTSGHFKPEANNTYDIGLTATRWKTGYFATALNIGAASTSNTTTTSHNTYISPASVILNAHSAAGGYHLYKDGVQYARGYISTVGTAGTATTFTDEGTGNTVTGYTGNTTGIAIMILGNGTAVGTNGTSYASPGTAGAANNARGYLRLYGAGTNYTDLLAQGNGNRTCYLPNYAGAMYLVHGGSNSAIGSATLPVYVAANGRVTACTAGSVFSALSWTAGTTAGPTLSITIAGQNRTSAIPSASASASGAVTTDAQTFAGAKTFSGVATFSNTTASSSKTTGAVIISGGLGVAGSIYGNKVYGAVWNDYAEYRNTKEKIEPGRVIQENGDDTLRLAVARLLPGCEIVSDTFGFAIGKTEQCGTPVAATGRVLAYPYEDRELFKSYIGAPVCSGPNGTVSIMTEEEEAKYPSRIIGTISAVPDYEEWGEGKIKVNGRVWIRIK